MQSSSRVMVAGARGLVGSAIVRRLQRAGYQAIIPVGRAQADLTDQAATRALFDRERPEYVFLAAARVGGIRANDSYPADFIRDNLLIQTNVIDAAFRVGVTKLLFLGSSCIYPKHAPQPMKEEHLLTGALEPTNEPYAVAKIAGMTMCRSYNRQHGTNYVSAMPTNLYGPGDNFDLATSHVLPALIRRFHEAKRDGAASVPLWGTGRPRREFLFVDDLADALLHLMLHFDTSTDGPDFVNVGVGEDVAITELAAMVADVVGYRGEIGWDSSMPDGTPRKLLDASRLRALGWAGARPLRKGIEETLSWYLAHAPPA